MRTKPTVRLLTHRTVAAMIDVDTETLREWVSTGDWPEPHSIVRQTWFFPKAAFDHYIETGAWPEGTRFKPGEGKGRKLLG